MENHETTPPTARSTAQATIAEAYAASNSAGSR
jgi:hypothetical protein